MRKIVLRRARDRFRHGRRHGATSGGRADHGPARVQPVPCRARQRAHAVRRLRGGRPRLVPGRLRWSAGLLHRRPLVAAGRRQLGRRLCRSGPSRRLRRRQGVRTVDPIQNRR